MGLKEQLLHDDLGREFSRIFKEHGYENDFGAHDFVVTDCLVSDAFRSNARISEALIEQTWPWIQRDTVVHYTRRRHAENLIDEKALRLYSLFKRVKQHEMQDFFRDHDLLGAFRDVNGSPGYHDQLRMMFYASFTKPHFDERENAEMWDEFSPQEDDVRLVFRIDAVLTDFRRVQYSRRSNPGVPLIRRLQGAVTQRSANHTLLFRGITRAAAFYLRGTYEHEQEYRLLYPRFYDGVGVIQEDSRQQQYVSLPLDGRFHFGYRATLQSVENRGGIDQNLMDKARQSGLI